MSAHLGGRPGFFAQLPASRREIAYRTEQTRRGWPDFERRFVFERDDEQSRRRREAWRRARALGGFARAHRVGRMQRAVNGRQCDDGERSRGSTGLASGGSAPGAGHSGFPRLVLGAANPIRAASRWQPVRRLPLHRSAVHLRWFQLCELRGLRRGVQRLGRSIATNGDRLRRLLHQQRLLRRRALLHATWRDLWDVQGRMVLERRRLRHRNSLRGRTARRGSPLRHSE